MLTLNDGRSELWQWDTGRKLNVDADCTQVHFSNKVFGRSIDVDVVDGVAIIPDILLQTDKELMAWAFVGTAENGYTKISNVFKVNKRNKPADYVFTPVEQMTISEIAAIAQSVRDDADAGMFDGKDGKDGTMTFEDLTDEQRESLKGEPGYTPIKGVDYFDGKDGKDGISATHSWNGTTLEITSASGTSSANLKGDKGDKGDRGEQGIQGMQGAKGETGAQGQKGADGTPATHRWSGTTLYITSASGTSSADLKGEKGDAYTLNDDDMERIAAAVKASLNTETLMITYEDGSTRAVEVVVK